MINKKILHSFFLSFDFLASFAFFIFISLVPIEILITSRSYIIEYSRALAGFLTILFSLYFAIVTFNKEIINDIIDESELDTIYYIYKYSLYLILLNIILIGFQDLLFAINSTYSYSFHYYIILPLSLYNILASFQIIDSVFRFMEYERKLKK